MVKVILHTQSSQISNKQDERNTYALMKTTFSPGYHRNSFVAIHALGHMMYGYTLLLPRKRRVLNKQSKERNISGHK